MSIKQHHDPLILFSDWLEEAIVHEPNDPSAACLATADKNAIPSARMILLKHFDSEGFVFYTNTGSRKGDELEVNPNAALCFHWKSIRRQVRVEGSTAPISSHAADEYFRTRPRSAQIGAWASTQSKILPNREALEGRFLNYETKFSGEDVSRPSHWSGYQLTAKRIEFWLNRDSRLHERLSYQKKAGRWNSELLFP